MVTIGYARVSSTDQDLAIQEEALRAAGCTIIRSEKRSGTKMEGRDQLQTILDFIHTGDVLTVTKLDRLARSVGDLMRIVDLLAEKGASLRVLNAHIDTSTASGKAFLGMLAIFAEFETNLRRERQLEGIAKAKADGRYKAVPPRSTLIRCGSSRATEKAPPRLPGPWGSDAPRCIGCSLRRSPRRGDNRQSRTIGISEIAPEPDMLRTCQNRRK